MNRTLPRRMAWPIATLLVSILSSTAVAQTFTWDGGNASGNWSLGGTGGNWSGGTAPTNGAALVFSGASHLADNVNDISSTTLTNITGLTFASGAGAFTLSGNGLDLKGNITNNSTSTETINLNLNMTAGSNASRTISATSGNIVIGGVITQSAVTMGLNISGSGGNQVVLNSANSYTGITYLNAGSTLKTSLLANGGVASGVGASSNAASNLVLHQATLSYTGGAATTDRLFSTDISSATAATIDASGTGAIVFSNTGSLAGPAAGGATLVLAGTNTGNNTLNPSWGDGTAANALTKNGAGTWVLGGANTYSGATTVNAGTLLVNGTNTVGSGTAGGYKVFSGATLGGSGTINLSNMSSGNNIVVSAGGSLSAGSSVGSVGTLTLNLGSSGALDLSAGMTAGALIFDLGATGDQIVLSSGILKIGTGLLNFSSFTFNDVGTRAGTYVLFSSNSAINGSLGTTLSGTFNGGLDAGTLSISGDNIVLTVTSVPEPSVIGCLLGGAALFGALFRSKRKAI